MLYHPPVPPFYCLSRYCELYIKLYSFCIHQMGVHKAQAHTLNHHLRKSDVLCFESLMMFTQYYEAVFAADDDVQFSENTVCRFCYMDYNTSPWQFQIMCSTIEF